MTTLITLVVLSHPTFVARPVAMPVARQTVFSERLRSALGEAWRVLVG